MPAPPSKLSELIDLALTDLKVVATDPRYTVDLGRWHMPIPHDGTCHVCLAGAVMANTLGVPTNEDTLPQVHGDEWRRALYALDDIRVAHFHSRDVEWFLPPDLIVPDEFDDIIVPDYDPENPSLFIDAITSIRDKFKELGA